MSAAPPRASPNPPADVSTALGSRLERAGAFYQERRLPEAERELEAAVELAPDDPRAYRLLARVRLRQGRAGDARDAYAKLAQRLPDDAQARFDLGLAALKIEDFAQAAAELEAALRLRPEDARAEPYLAYAWARLGRTSAAIAAFERAGASELAAATLAGATTSREVPIATLAADRLMGGSPLAGSPLASPKSPAEAGVERDLFRFVIEADSEAHVVPSALVTTTGDVTLSHAVRRRPGRIAEPNDTSQVRFMRCHGQGEVWVGARRAGTRPFGLGIEEDVVFLREARVLGWAGALTWEVGTLPGSGAALLHLSGRGRVLVDWAATDIIAVRVSPAQKTKLIDGRLLGWLGQLVFTQDDTSGAAASSGGSGTVIACEGEGVLLIARHGDAQ